MKVFAPVLLALALSMMSAAVFPAKAQAGICADLLSKVWSMVPLNISYETRALIGGYYVGQQLSSEANDRISAEIAARGYTLVRTRDGEISEIAIFERNVHIRWSGGGVDNGDDYGRPWQQAVASASRVERFKGRVIDYRPYGIQSMTAGAPMGDLIIALQNGKEVRFVLRVGQNVYFRKL